MDQIIGFCGIICTECPAYIATINNDNVLRKRTSEEWTKEFKSEYKPEDINCEGCHSNNLNSKYCLHCEIRKCGLTKNIQNCGYCIDYPCGKITEFHKLVPEAKKVLDKIKLNS